MYEKWYFKVLAVFSVGFWLESGKLCKNNDHRCLFHCINTCPVTGEMLDVFKQLPWAMANVNA